MSARLHLIDANPAPAGAAAGLLTAYDGRRLRYAVFPAPAAPPRGTVILLTGRNEAIEKYFETARDLGLRGFASVAFDWRGQGASERLLRDPLRGHVRTFGDYAADFERLIEAVVTKNCPPPFFVLAHSAGALVALLAAPRLVGMVQRMVLTAPLLGLDGFPLSLKGIHRVARAMSLLGLGTRYLGGGPRPRNLGFEANLLTTDPARFRRNAVLTDTFPALRLGGPTAAWVRGACDAIATVTAPAFMAASRMPVLFVAAGLDRVVSTPAIERYARALPGAALVTIDGARHELLQEADRYRDQVFAAFDAFVPGGEVSAREEPPAPPREAPASPPR